MIRQENRFLVLIHYHEVLDVLPRNLTFKVTETQEVLTHVVWIRNRDLRDLVSPRDEVQM